MDDEHAEPPDIFTELGVPTVINACGPVTRLSGGMMHPAVAAAMVAVSGACVDMVTLQAAACRLIRSVTGAEAGIVTSGASAAILLASAACLAGLDPGRINRLPEVRDGRNEIIIVRSQRNMYDRAMVVAGARLVEIGIPDRFSGPGIRDADAWEIEEAIGPATAAVYYLAQRHSAPPLRMVTAVAHARGVPVIVDAAAELPPRGNLARFLEEGADLVAFSGGKVIGGPQASGILCGRADLISSALIQMIDLDVAPETWAAPTEFAPLASLRGLPHHGIGRSCKVGKEEIVGLMAALRRFTAEAPADRRARWTEILRAITDEAGTSLNLDLRLMDDQTTDAVPKLAVFVRDAAAVQRRLAAGAPAIHCLIPPDDPHRLLFSPVALAPLQAGEIGKRLREIAAELDATIGSKSNVENG